MLLIILLFGNIVLLIILLFGNLELSVISLFGITSPPSNAPSQPFFFLIPFSTLLPHSPTQWDEKQLVAALERASLLDLQKLLKVQPIKAANNNAQLGSVGARRGRFMPAAEAVANIRLNVSYVNTMERSLKSRVLRRK